MTLDATETTSYRRLFGISEFPQLAAGSMFARTANQLWQIVLVLFVLQRFRSPALAGAAVFVSIAPGLAVSPIAGAMLDRHGRMRLILLDYSLAATALVLLGVLAGLHLLTPLLLLCIVGISSLTGPLSASGTRTLFPTIVPRELWDRANAVDSGSQALASVVGPAAAGFLVAWIGGEGGFLVTAGVFVCAALVILGVHDPLEQHKHSEVQAQPLLRSAWQALVYVLRHATLRGIMLTLLCGNIGFGILTVALPVLVLGRFHWGDAMVGELWSVAGVATVATGLFVGRLNTEGRERRMVAIGMGLAAIGCALLVVANAAPVLLLAMAVIGISAGPSDIGLFALRQRRTDPRWFGRAFAVSMSLNFAGAPVGSALAGPLLEYSVPLTLAIAVLVSLLACVVPFFAIPREA